LDAAKQLVEKSVFLKMNTNGIITRPASAEALQEQGGLAEIITN
jgi:hypothetical protein